MKEVHGVELEAKLLAETNLRNLESQITNYMEKMKKMVGQLQEHEEENRKVSEKRGRGGDGRN